MMAFQDAVCLGGRRIFSNLLKKAAIEGEKICNHLHSEFYIFLAFDLQLLNNLPSIICN